MKEVECKDFHRYVKSFKSFKSRHKLTDKQIALIMTEYANTVDEQSASFFANKYAISEYEFYRIKDYTIVFMLVDANICIRLRDKSFRNQGSNNPTGNYSSSYQHYKNLINLRKCYLKSFSNEEIIQIADQYVQGLAIYDIAKKHQITMHTVRRLLAIALTTHLVNETAYLQIKSRSLAYLNSLPAFNGYTVDDLWNHSYWE